MTTLLVTLPSQPADAGSLYDYVLSNDGMEADKSASVPAALLPAVGSSGEIVALVPPHRLSWHQVQLPKGTLSRGMLQDAGNPRLRSVLEGLLEERLLDDTQHLHFALAPSPQADAPVWVAVCDRAWLRTAMQALEQSGRPANRIVPEFAPDFPVDVLYVKGDPDQAQMVFTARGGVSVWPLSTASVALLDWPPTSSIVAEPAVAALVEQLFQRPVTLQQAAQHALQAIQSPWDLAQFDLVSSSRTRVWKRAGKALSSFVRSPRWRAARLALLALLLVNLVGVNAKAWKEKSAIESKRAAVSELLVSTFPSVRVVVDAPLQMAREVAALQQAGGVASSRDLESMLGSFAAVAPANTVANAVEFTSNELRLKGLKLTQEELSELSFKLNAQGYSAVPLDDGLLIKQGGTP
jgi:general secretion pathway protein L